ncbi:MAG: Stp1/IreP family PP2C-type Ser/Thr phosphatase [Gaiellales bacterium]
MSVTVIDRAVVTRTGNVRRTNEDAYLIAEPLFVVADGMGGAQAGEIAARMAADEFGHLDAARARGEQALREIIGNANQRILERAKSDPELAGMGTTVIAALVGDDGRVAFGHVGDSRAYLLRDGDLQQLSEDHSLVSELVRAGELSEAEAERHPQRSVITRALGADPNLQVDTFTVDGRPGDIVLLCSDGLNTMVDEPTIARLMASGASAEETARELVKAALAGGGEDNVTAIVFRLGETEGDGAVTPAVTAEATPAGRSRGGRALRMTARVVAVVMIAGLLAAGAVAGLRWSHFVGADQATGRVAVYQGLPVNLPFGLRLYRETYESGVLYATLSTAQRKQLFDHRLRSSADAVQAVRTVQAETP